MSGCEDQLFKTVATLAKENVRLAEENVRLSEEQTKVRESLLEKNKQLENEISGLRETLTAAQKFALEGHSRHREAMAAVQDTLMEKNKRLENENIQLREKLIASQESFVEKTSGLEEEIFRLRNTLAEPQELVLKQRAQDKSLREAYIQLRMDLDNANRAIGEHLTRICPVTIAEPRGLKEALEYRYERMKKLLTEEQFLNGYDNPGFTSVVVNAGSRYEHEQYWEINGPVLTALGISKETCEKHKLHFCATKFSYHNPGRWSVSATFEGGGTIAFRYEELPPCGSWWGVFKHVSIKSPNKNL